MDEAEIVEGCRRGRRDAQRLLYERCVQRVYAVTLRMTRSREAAADLTHTAFIRAFERVGDFNGRADVGTWLYRIAVNEALQWLRRRRVERRGLAAMQPGVSGRRAVLKPAAEAVDARIDLEEGMARLSEDHRAILILKYQEDLGYDEIAAALEIPPGTIASRLNRARAELRRLLDEPPRARDE